MQRNATLNSLSFGGITGAGDNAALTAGNQRLSFEFRMNGLFAGSEEGIAVNVDNRPRPGIEIEDKIGHKNIKG
jgi:hypothetical protein